MVVQVYIPSVFLESKRAAFFGLKSSILILRPWCFGALILCLRHPECHEDVG